MTVRAETEVTLTRVNDGDNGVKVYDGTAGSVVTVSNASEYPALELVADIIPIQPNDYDSVWVGGAGKNVCVPLEGTKNGIVRTLNDNGTVAITGKSTANSWSYLEKYYDLPYCGIDVGDTISIYSDVYIAVMAYNGSTSLGSKSSKDGNSATYTIPANTTRLRIIQYPKSVTPVIDEEFDTTAKYWVSKSAFSSWEPYENICPIYGHDHCNVVVSPTLLDTDGTTYTTTFPSTVYGGTLDVVNGTLTVTHGYEIVDGNHTMSNQISARDRVFFQLTAMESGSHTDDGYNKCNQMVVEQNTGNTFTYPNIRLGANNNYVYLNGVKEISGVTDLDSLKTWLNSNPVTFTYPLDTPVVYSLSPKEIELLNGTNNVWATTGDITDFRYAEIAPATLETFGDARKVAVKYVTDMGDDGIIVHPEGDTSNSVALYGRTARIGAEESSRIEIMPDVFSVVSPEGIEPFRVETGDVVTSEQKIRKYISKVIPKNTTYNIELSEILSPITTGTSFTFEGYIYIPGSVNDSVKQAFVKGTSATYTVSNITLAYNATSQILTVTNSSGLDFLISNIWYYAYVRNSKIYLLSDLLADFVIDEGFDLSTTWRYCKWHSGKVEAWYHDQTYIDIWQTKINTSAHGGFYISDNLDVPDFPDGLFSSSGTIQRFASAASEDNYFVQCLIKDNAGWADNTNFGDVYWSTTSARSSLHNYYIDLYAVQFPPNN